MFTFSIIGNSTGYATPVDAEIETVFKTDVEKSALKSEVSTIFETQKVADVEVGNAIVPDGSRIIKNAYDIWLIDSKFNYNSIATEDILIRKDIPILIPLKF